VCIDDIKHQLDKSNFDEKELKKTEEIMKMVYGKKNINEIEVEDIIRPHEPWEVNQRCLKSIFNIGIKPK
jgi:hypothetical protein